MKTTVVSCLLFVGLFDFLKRPFKDDPVKLVLVARCLFGFEKSFEAQGSNGNPVDVNSGLQR